MNNDSQQITPPDDWCGELDGAYVSKWTRWAERQTYHRWSATMPSRDELSSPLHHRWIGPEIDQ